MDDCCKDSKYRVYLNFENDADKFIQFLNEDSFFNFTPVQKELIKEIITSSNKIMIFEGDYKEQGVVADYLILNGFNPEIKKHSLVWK